MKKSQKMNTFLGEDTKLEGKLRFHGIARVDGQFLGDVSADGILIVGEKGRVEGNSHVASVELGGEIRGDVLADDRIEILTTGRVFGDIQSPIVIMQEGAILQGHCQTQKVEKQTQTSLSLSTEEEPEEKVSEKGDKNKAIMREI